MCQAQCHQFPECQEACMGEGLDTARSWKADFTVCHKEVKV